MNYHGIHIGNVKPGFNNGSGHQHVDLPADEFIHNLLKLMLLHLPMGKLHGNLRDKLLDVRRNLCNILHPVIHIVDLPLSRTFPLNGFPYHLIVIFHHIGLNRHTVIGRLL